MSEERFQFVIREATRGDLPRILRLQEIWMQEDITYGYVPDAHASIEAKLGPFLRVAEVDGQVVGFAAGSVRVSDGLAVIPAGERYLEVDDLYVHPSMRGREIGGKLLEDLMQVAREHGLRKALVYSAIKDIRRIMNFYEAHGFRSWFVQMFREL